MRAKSKPGIKLEIHPLSPARWPDLVKLFGNRGACGGCWCMFWRLPRAQWVRQKGAANKQALRRLADTAEPPGLIAYAGAEPVGWCALAPRDDYPRLDNSRILKRIDDQPVWSIPCFFVARDHRRQGITLALLQEATHYAAQQGAAILEGYPCDPKPGYPDVFYYTGLASAFRKAGFKEAARRSPDRPIFRCQLTPSGKRRRPRQPKGTVSRRIS